MEENLYIFIIWHKVLWAKKKIIDDINKSFQIEKIINVCWDEKKYEENILAFYGTKISNVKNKIRKIGKGEFCIVVYKDLNPIFKEELVYDKKIKVNVHAFEKKKLYRKWTGYDFRVHGSDNDEETIHDLTILFGNDYHSLLSSSKYEIYVNNNTKGLLGFKNECDFKETINIIGDSKIMKADDCYVVLTNCRFDLVRFLGYEKFDLDYIYVSINDKNEKVYILGVDENDISKDMKNQIPNNEKVKQSFLSIIEKYSFYLSGSNNEVIDFLKKNNFNHNRKAINTIRVDVKDSIITMLKKSIRYNLAWVRNICQK